MTNPTAYWRLSPWCARLLLIAILALVTLPAFPHAPLNIPGEREYWGQPLPAKTDASLYKAILSDVKRGENYYQAAAREQRASGYPTAPAEVFRPPTLAWLLAGMHYHVIQVATLFGLYAAILIGLYRELRARQAPLLIRLGTIIAAVTGLSITGLPGAIYLHEVWAALLIAASLLFYRAERWWPSVVFGVLACLIREIALPYLAVMAVFAAFERRWRELAAWSSAMAGFACFYVWHISQAATLHRAGDLNSAGWLGLGGWNFAIATAKWNILLHMLPPELIALAVCLGVIGLAGFDDGRSRRAAMVVAGYLIAFVFVGRPDNYYWGQLYAPLLPLGIVFAPGAIRDLVLRACGRTATIVPRSS
jgi:hypothetical protein